MRPLELRLKGFRSYREEAVFDWRGRHLVGIVGPIGAGKSSILDAVAFALYGKTPTFERDTKSLINQTASECHVELRFEVDGEVWRAARGLRRKGASGHQLQRLADDSDRAEVLEPITGEKQVRERVERLLGMDFAAFCRSVLLAQNRFDDFLKATPRDRNEVLKGVFGYERFDAALEGAKRRVVAAQLLLESLEREGAQLTTARAQLELAEARCSTAVARATALEEAKAPYEETAGAVRDAERARAEADAETAAIHDVAALVPAREEIDAATEAALASVAVVDAAADAVERADADQARAEATHAAVAERVGDQIAFEALVTRHEHLVEGAHRAASTREACANAKDEADATAQALATAHAEAGVALAEADSSIAAAELAAADAERAMHEARHADMARTLRSALEAGAACPVCEQPVTTIPKAGRAPAIAGLEKALTRARRIEGEARTSQRTAAAAVATADERLTSARARADERARDLEGADEALRVADAELAAAQSELVDRLGEGDPRALLDERRRELAEAAAATERAVAEASRARVALEEARRAGDAGRDGLSGLANRLASIWGMLGESRTVASEPDAVRDAFVAAGEAVIERAERSAEAARAADRAAADARTRIVELFERAGLAPADDFTLALATASAERAAAEEQVRGLIASIEAGADLDERLARTRRDHALAKRLVDDLQPSRFLAFLLEEERRALAELGSAHFEELTGSAYRFTDDDRFEVLDMNAAGTERRADSLSGGETFLASLALALALAEIVARGGGRLDAFFLDEGFGSLDPEHLDRAMDGIGRLVANDPRRLVVLVSHVEQMREMLEDLIVLDKHDLTGDTVVVAGATR